MRILITGAAGFLGARLARTLLAQPSLTLAGQAGTLDELWLTDQFAPPADLQADARTQFRTGDLRALLARGELDVGAMDAIVHLASAVSAECEADLDLGLNSNLLTSLELLQAARHGARKPLFVFASSLAVFGAPPGQTLPAVITDEHGPQPQGSYGTQKFMIEQLVSDFSRRGLIVGRNVRLMTVSVRPGRPNGAASGFFSGMLREPLAGQRAVVPVAPETPVALASPRNTIAGLLAALSVDPQRWGPATAVNFPALSTTVGEMAQTLAEMAGPEAAALLDWKADERIAVLVHSWPARIDARRAAGLGLLPDASVADLIRIYAQENPAAIVHRLKT